MTSLTLRCRGPGARLPACLVWCGVVEGRGGKVAIGFSKSQKELHSDGNGCKPHQTPAGGVQPAGWEKEVWLHRVGRGLPNWTQLHETQIQLGCSWLAKIFR